MCIFTNRLTRTHIAYNIGNNSSNNRTSNFNQYLRGKRDILT